mmetsp:Transcript_32729/g.86018  ORF Transcript_32729/g.86018 Transcript_32729/m.86018 type:complete len:310 (-) Transcript_32729:121-1050(-)
MAAAVVGRSSEICGCTTRAQMHGTSSAGPLCPMPSSPSSLRCSSGPSVSESMHASLCASSSDASSRPAEADQAPGWGGASAIRLATRARCTRHAAVWTQPVSAPCLAFAGETSSSCIRRPWPRHRPAAQPTRRARPRRRCARFVCQDTRRTTCCYACLASISSTRTASAAGSRMTAPAPSADTTSTDHRPRRWRTRRFGARAAAISLMRRRVRSSLARRSTEVAAVVLAKPRRLSPMRCRVPKLTPLLRQLPTRPANLRVLGSHPSCGPSGAPERLGARHLAPSSAKMLCVRQWVRPHRIMCTASCMDI